MAALLRSRNNRWIDPWPGCELGSAQLSLLQPLRVAEQPLRYRYRARADSVLALSARGYSVLPVCPRGRVLLDIDFPACASRCGGAVLHRPHLCGPRSRPAARLDYFCPAACRADRHGRTACHRRHDERVAHCRIIPGRNLVVAEASYGFIRRVGALCFRRGAGRGSGRVQTDCRRLCDWARSHGPRVAGIGRHAAATTGMPGDGRRRCIPARVRAVGLVCVSAHGKSGLSLLQQYL